MINFKGGFNVKNRIKKIRNDNKLTMEQFGNRIGITRSSVSLLESGKNNPSEQTIRLICQEFNVREEWLRTGEEPMTSEDDRYSHNLAHLTMPDDEMIIRWVNAIAETHPDTLRQIEAFMKKVLDIE